MAKMPSVDPWPDVEMVIDVRSAWERVKPGLKSKKAKTFSRRASKSMELYFGLFDGDEKTLEDIGKRYGVTRERARQIIIRALRMLRHSSRTKSFEVYIDTPRIRAERAKKQARSQALEPQRPQSKVDTHANAVITYINNYPGHTAMKSPMHILREVKTVHVALGQDGLSRLSQQFIDAYYEAVKWAIERNITWASIKPLPIEEV